MEIKLVDVSIFIKTAVFNSLPMTPTSPFLAWTGIQLHFQKTCNATIAHKISQSRQKGNYKTQLEIKMKLVQSAFVLFLASILPSLISSVSFMLSLIAQQPWLLSNNTPPVWMITNC